MIEAVNECERVRAELSDLIQDMLYISETEAELELLPADVLLKDQTAVEASLPDEAISESGEAFLRKLRDTIDPTDEGLWDYRHKWENFFRFLNAASDDIRVYRSGPGPVEIHIVAIVDSAAVIVKTHAVET